MALMIREQSTTCSLFPNYVVAKAHTAALIGTKKFILTGFGCSISKSKAITSAIGELNERVWSSPSIQSALGTRLLAVESMTGKNLQNASVKGVAGLAPEFSFELSKDATGYAYHYSRLEAIEHGVRELIERHLTWKIWMGHTQTYARQTVLKCLDRHYDLYTLQIQGLPYCLAVCVGSDFLSIGAKCSFSFQAAIDGAISEAIMIYEEYRGSARSMPPARHVETIKKLRNSRYRQETLVRILDNTNFTTEQITEPEASTALQVVQMINIDPEQINIASYPTLNGNCIRAFSSVTKNPKFNLLNDQLIPML
ncbi:hypothetical protein DXT88_18525 [Herbaspirillum lusitanum]|uniref:YcaO-like family protein n=1 Tax=Herbaspirillum lusitanum TaxID=213312 RepID=UPI002237AE6B|nr:YcaO-like family protein [Herbaspirillum lusitanum]MCW5300169.1 hypothetical protein [Herbaspirillum lusitanum]